MTNAVVSFDQGELADMHEDAIRGYKHKRGASQEKAYEQDLANRAYNLPRRDLRQDTAPNWGQDHSDQQKPSSEARMACRCSAAWGVSDD